MFDYKKISNLVSINNKELVLDFKGVSFLDVSEITELMFHITNVADFENYTVVNPSPATSYLRRVNFFNLLENLQTNITPNKLGRLSPNTGNHAHLLETQKYNNQAEFYVNQEKIFNALIDIGLSGEATALLVSSLGEVIDNAFIHNLGKWESRYGPLAVSLMQDYPEKRTIDLLRNREK